MHRTFVNFCIIVFLMTHTAENPMKISLSVHTKNMEVEKEKKTNKQKCKTAKNEWILKNFTWVYFKISICKFQLIFFDHITHTIIGQQIALFCWKYRFEAIKFFYCLRGFGLKRFYFYWHENSKNCFRNVLLTQNTHMDVAFSHFFHVFADFSNFMPNKVKIWIW